MISFQETLTFDDVNIVPDYSDISSRSNCDVSTRFTKRYKIDIPIISSPMDTVTGKEMAKRMSQLGGVGVVHRFCTVEEQIEMLNWPLMVRPGIFDTKNLFDFIPRCGAVGIRGHYLERAELLVESGVNVILIDVAHGHHYSVRTALNSLKGLLPYYVDIIVGNVATAEGARFLCAAGADGIRVGIGNGSLCETRIRTGVGVPQVTALRETVDACKVYDVPVIADGGMRFPGDVAKALALGAESCIFGSLFAGTKETPGIIHKSGQWPNETLYKTYRGSASLDSKIDVSDGKDQSHVEGNSTRVAYKGKVGRIVDNILDGVRSSMSYVGVDNLPEFRENATFVRVTDAGRIEASPHLLNK